MNEKLSFRDQLIAVESRTSESRQQLEQELHAMFVRELSTPHRAFIALVAVGSLASGAVCGYLALTEPTLPILARIGLGVGTLFGLAWTVVAARVALRGAMDLRVDSRRIAAMVWIFTTSMMVFFLMLGMSIQDRLLGLMMIANGLAFLIGAGVYWLNHRIEQAELSTREQFLRLELRLAELGQKQ
jgi:MFS family permease